MSKISLKLDRLVKLKMDLYRYFSKCKNPISLTRLCDVLFVWTFYTLKKLQGRSPRKPFYCRICSTQMKTPLQLHSWQNGCWFLVADGGGKSVFFVNREFVTKRLPPFLTVSALPFTLRRVALPPGHLCLCAVSSVHKSYAIYLHKFFDNFYKIYLTTFLSFAGIFVTVAVFSNSFSQPLLNGRVEVKWEKHTAGTLLHRHAHGAVSRHSTWHVLLQDNSSDRIVHRTGSRRHG